MNIIHYLLIGLLSLCPLLQKASTITFEQGILHNKFKNQKNESAQYPSNYFDEFPYAAVCSSLSNRRANGGYYPLTFNRQAYHLPASQELLAFYTQLSEKREEKENLLEQLHLKKLSVAALLDQCKKNSTLLHYAKDTDLTTIENIQKRITYYNTVLEECCETDDSANCSFRDIEFILWDNRAEKDIWTNDSLIRSLKNLQDSVTETEQNCTALHALIKEADTNRDTLEKIQKAFLADA